MSILNRKLIRRSALLLAGAAGALAIMTASPASAEWRNVPGSMCEAKSYLNNWTVTYNKQGNLAPTQCPILTYAQNANGYYYPWKTIQTIEVTLEGDGFDASSYASQIKVRACGQEIFDPTAVNCGAYTTVTNFDGHKLVTVSDLAGVNTNVADFDYVEVLDSYASVGTAGHQGSATVAGVYVSY
jgi:hypothetical protein